MCFASITPYLFCKPLCHCFTATRNAQTAPQETVGRFFCACARPLCCTHRSDGWPAARSAIAFAAGLRAAQMLAGGGGIKVGGSFDPCGSGGGFELQVLTTGEFCVTYRCALLNKMIAYMLSQ